MKRYGWAQALLFMTSILASPYPSAARCGGGGQMGQNMTGYGRMGGSGHMGSGNMGNGYMGGSGQMGPDNMGNYNYADPYAPVPGQPGGTWAPATSGQATGNPNPSGHNHTH